MATIVSVHSFCGGTGKSNMTANLAALLAGAGKRVGVIDTDIQSPGIHVLFGPSSLSGGQMLLPKPPSTGDALQVDILVVDRTV